MPNKTCMFTEQRVLRNECNKRLNMLHNILFRGSGIMFTCICILTIEILYRAGLTIPFFLVIFLLPIFLFLTTSSIKEAFPTLVIAFVYTIHYFLFHIDLIRYSHTVYSLYQPFYFILLLATILLCLSIVQLVLRKIHTLKESQSNLARAEELSFVMVIHLSLNRQLIKFPQSFCKLLGYSEQELRGKKYDSITYPEDQLHDWNSYDALLTGNINSFENEKRFLSKAGIPVWTYTNVSLVTSKSGTPLHYLVYVRDISIRKAAEKEMRKMAHYLQMITDNMLDVICQVDHAGIIRYISPSSTSVLGYDPAHVIGGICFQDVHPDDLSIVQDAFHQAISLKSPTRVEFRYKHAKGNYIWLEVIGNPIKDVPMDKGSFMLCARDISQRKTAEQALLNSEKQYRQLIDVIPEAVLVLSGDCLSFINPAGVKLLGVESYRDVVGKEITTYLKPPFFSGKTLWDNENDVVHISKLPLTKPDGTQIEIEGIAVPFHSHGESSILSVVRDMNERKEVEQLQRSFKENERKLQEAIELDKFKTDFFSNLSHELRTPLNVILGTLQLLELFGKDPLSADTVQKTRRYNAIMKQNCLRLLRLVNNLIDMTKIDAGFFSIALRNANIVYIVEEVTMSVVEYANNKSIRLIFDTDTEEVWTACDPDKIERVLLNLLSNAMKFTPPGGSISVSITTSADYLTISVSDTGIGIPSDKLNIIFDRFRQVDKSLTRSHEGSGIGLSLVKSLVEMHEGEITVKSEYGKGSEFVVMLPIRLSADNTYLEDKSFNKQDTAEHIHIEFSDIYQLPRTS